MVWAVTAPPPPTTIPTVTEIQDPGSFETQKLVHVELLEPGLQVFATPQLAEQQTALVAQHLASPTTFGQISPFFSAIPYVGQAYQASQYFDQAGLPPIAQFTANVKRAQEALRATSLTGLATLPAISGRVSPALLQMFGEGSPAFSALMMNLARFSGSQASRILAGRRSGFLQAAGLRPRRRARRIFPWGVME